MFPNVYGWSWTPAHVIFVGVFFAVGLTVALTVLIAWWRAQRDLRAGRADAIRWQEEFHDLPRDFRRCRHEIRGRVPRRECERGFECSACDTHPKLASADGGGDLLYHRGHTWVRPEADGTLRVGLDDLALQMIGPDAKIELPEPGTRVQVHAPLGRVRLNGHEARVLSPVTGDVIQTTGRAEFRVRPSSGPLTHLLSGEEALAWQAHEQERLQRIAGEPDRSRVWGAMLLEP